MTVTSLLKDLKHTTRLLQAVDQTISDLENEDRQNIVSSLSKDNRPDLVFNETFPTLQARTVFDTVLADISTANAQLSLLICVLSGQALKFQGIDAYSMLSEEDFTEVVDQFFNEHKNGTSGLEGLLRPAGDEEITDEEVFETYRVMGCQSVEMWGISIHRMLLGVIDEAEEFARSIWGEAQAAGWTEKESE